MLSRSIGCLICVAAALTTATCKWRSQTEPLFVVRQDALMSAEVTVEASPSKLQVLQGSTGALTAPVTLQLGNTQIAAGYDQPPFADKDGRTWAGHKTTEAGWELSRQIQRRTAGHPP